MMAPPPAASSAAAPRVCRAYTYSKPGPPSQVLRLEAEHTVPRPGPDELLIKVRAAALNPVDWKLMGLVPRLVGKNPAVTGCDYSGTVLESRSPLFQPGDEVFGMVGSKLKVTRGLGTLAEIIVAPAQTCAKLPDTRDGGRGVGVAGASLVGLTALEMTKAVDSVKGALADDGQPARVLVCGGSTSVGLSLLPILRDKGCEVAATCSKGKDSLVRERGAHETFDYSDAHFLDSLQKSCESKRPFDVILDCVDSIDIWHKSAALLIEAGVFMNVGMDTSSGLARTAYRLMSYYVWPRFLGGVPRRYARPAGFGTRERMDELRELIERGVLVPLVDSEFDFEHAHDAFERLKSNKATGKVVIHVSQA
ncbi:unnamed protein product [Parajaminaea phylloscopi]